MEQTHITITNALATASAFASRQDTGEGVFIPAHVSKPAGLQIGSEYRATLMQNDVGKYQKTPWRCVSIDERIVTVSGMQARRVALADQLEHVLAGKDIDAPYALARVLGKRLDAELAEMLVEIIGLYETDGSDNEAFLAHAECLADTANQFAEERGV